MIDTGARACFNVDMDELTVTVVFENSDYSLTDLEDHFDWYRQADEVPTLDLGLHMVWDEQVTWRA